MQALILAGAKLTLALGLTGMIARVLVGTVLGASAAWWSGTWLDRFVRYCWRIPAGGKAGSHRWVSG
jgi:ABC-type dipeptide/oligopeptide/nickel transport system permease component